MSSVNGDSFLCSFTICMPFLFFSCLNTLARISNTFLNRRHERGHPYLVLDFRGKASSFSPLRIVLAVGFSSKSFNKIEKVITYSYFAESSFF